MAQDALCTALKYHFGHDRFRPFQLEAVQATLSGRDSLLILPTGGGKSLTFQLPPLAKGNCFTVVVGPLMALAKDQVDSCLELGLDARVWNSDTLDEARKGIQSELVSDAPEMRLLYTTPESLRNPTLRGYLKEAYEAGTLLGFSIDEAHCVSEWGHDFRPAYLELASLKQDFPKAPIAAMTASCTPAVEAGIIKLLRLQDPLLIKGGFNRPNIQYKVLYKELINEGKQDDLVEHLVAFIKQREGQCGIIYARLRATCDWLGSALGNCDLDVGVYHAGKDAQRRRKVQQDWSGGALDIVVATVAFGMGIDRADVRWVVHWDVPASLEGYYQESGRAGRDGQPSEAVLYVSADDLDTLTKHEKGNRAGSAAAVASFSCQGGCKRKKLLDYFGQKRSACDASQGDLLCDYCSQPGPTRALMAQWEQQLQRKTVAHMMREQRAAAGLSSSGEDEGGQEETAAGCGGDAASNDTHGAMIASAAVGAAAAGGHGGWQASNALAGGSSSSSAQAGTRPRAGVWAPAAHWGPAQHAAEAAATPEAALHGSRSSSMSSCMAHTAHLDENMQPSQALADPAAAAAAVQASCAARGVLPPLPPGQQAAAAVTAKGPAEVPQIRKRRGQQQPWGAFKAPRQQQGSSSSSNSSSKAGEAACALAADDAVEHAATQQGQQQQLAADKAAAPQQQHPAATAQAAGGMGLRRGMGRAGAQGRQGFTPPFRRSS